MKVKSLSVQGFRGAYYPKTYQFRDINYLHGPNGSGKSTVMLAIQLALLGYIPGTNKRKSDIFRHASSNVMSITVTLDDEGSDVTVTRTWTGTSSSVSSTFDVVPKDYPIDNILSDIELPVFNFNDFLSMSANQMKDWFIDFLPSQDVNIDWDHELDKCLLDNGVPLLSSSDMKSTFLKEVKACGQSGINQVRWANTYFKQLQSFKKSEDNRLTDTIKSLIHYDDVDDTISLSEVNSKIEFLRSKQNQCIKNAEILSSNSRIEKAIDDLNLPYDVSSDDPKRQAFIDEARLVKIKLNNLSETRPDLMSTYNTKFSEFSSLNADYEAKKKSSESSTTCPYTNKECDDLKDMIKSASDDLNDLENSLDKLREEIKKVSESIRTLDSSVSELSSKYNEIINDIKSLDDKYKRKSDLKSMIVSVDDNLDTDSSKYDEDIRNLDATRIKIEANKKYSTMIDTLSKSKYDIQLELEALKKWVALTGVNGLQTSSESGNPFDTLKDSMLERVIQMFGEGCSPKFNLEAKSNSFSFGLDRGGKYIPYDLLSGGEKCMYSLCLMMSLVDSSSSALKLIMVDDSFDHLDKKNIEVVFKALSNVKDIQMIFAGVNDVELAVKNEFNIEVKND